MTLFRTDIQVGKAPFEILPGDGIMMIGSCFAENIGQKFTEARFDAFVNPFGVLYNPVSVADALASIIENRVFADNDLAFDGQLWHSHFHHGSFSGPHKDDMLARINQTVQAAHHKLRQAKYLFITLGTAWVYEEKASGRVVANCHKFPDAMFNRYRLTPDKLVERLSQLIDQLRTCCPSLNILFTVSPVRHWKDTAHGNQLSKSVLLLAIDQLCNQYGHISYFPAYELVLDDLRDYRFYADDMLHPNAQAIHYIWGKLQEFCFGPQAVEFAKWTHELSKALQHKPFNPHTPQHLKFLESLLTKIDKIEKTHPKTDLMADKNDVKKRIEQLAPPQK